MEAMEAKGKPWTSKKKVAILLYVAGQEAVEAFNICDLMTEEQNSYDTLLEKFEHHCMPKCNETDERYVFRC